VRLLRIEVVNRRGFELIPGSWTNFKGFYDEYKTELTPKVVQSFLGAKAAQSCWLGASVPEEKIHRFLLKRFSSERTSLATPWCVI
jgi:hypothetical protein